MVTFNPKIGVGQIEEIWIMTISDIRWIIDEVVKFNVVFWSTFKSILYQNIEMERNSTICCSTFAAK